MAEVYSHQRSPAAACDFGRAQDCAITAEHDHNFEIGDPDIRTQHCDGRQIGSESAKIVEFVVGEYRNKARILQLTTDGNRSGERILTPGVSNDQDVAVGGRRVGESHCSI